MHNNRAWHQEYMFVEYMAGVRGRGADRAEIGSTLRDPFIDYAKMAATYGMAGEGPIHDPAKLSAALQRGVASVKRSPDPVFGHDERTAGKHRTGKRGQWEGAVLHLRLLRLPRLQR
jgi:hypothetical protein